MWPQFRIWSWGAGIWIIGGFKPSLMLNGFVLAAGMPEDILTSSHWFTRQGWVTQKTRHSTGYSSHFDLQEREWTYHQLCSAACSLRDHLLKEGLCPSRGASWIMETAFLLLKEKSLRVFLTFVRWCHEWCKTTRLTIFWWLKSSNHSPLSRTRCCTTERIRWVHNLFLSLVLWSLCSAHFGTSTQSGCQHLGKVGRALLQETFQVLDSKDLRVSVWRLSWRVEGKHLSTRCFSGRWSFIVWCWKNKTLFDGCLYEDRCASGQRHRLQACPSQAIITKHGTLVAWYIRSTHLSKILVLHARSGLGSDRGLFRN